MELLPYYTTLFVSLAGGTSMTYIKSRQWMCMCILALTLAQTDPNHPRTCT